MLIDVLEECATLAALAAFTYAVLSWAEILASFV